MFFPELGADFVWPDAVVTRPADHEISCFFLGFLLTLWTLFEAASQPPWPPPVAVSEPLNEPDQSYLLQLSQLCSHASPEPRLLSKPSEQLCLQL